MMTVLVAALLAQMPLSKGAKWTYGTDQEVDFIYEVTGTEKVGETECFVLEVRTSEDKLMRREWLTSDEKGVKVHQALRGKHIKMTIEKPYFKVKAPFEKGASWEGESKTSDGKVSTYKAEVVAEEEVKVPAGAYKAWRLKTSHQSDAGGVTAVEWWAPDVGMVRAEFEFSFGGSVTPVTYELKEFKKGGK